MNQYRLYIIIAIILILISMLFTIKIINESSDLITVASMRKLPIEIENDSNNIIRINGVEMKPHEKKNIFLNEDEKIIITDNLGTIIIKSFDKVYKVKLKNFEVVVENGKN
jgi:hypothetical protein